MEIIKDRYYTTYKMKQKNNICCFVLDVDLFHYPLPKNYGIQSYIQFCRNSQIDLIVQHTVNPKYIVQGLDKYIFNRYYTYTISQTFCVYDLFDAYDFVMVGAQNDVLLTQNMSIDKNILTDNVDVIFSYCTKSNCETSVNRNQCMFLLNKYFKFNIDDSVRISLFNNIYNKTTKEMFNIQQYKKFINYSMNVDPFCKNQLWDHYSQSINKLLLQKKNYIINKNVSIQGCFMNDQHYTVDIISDTITNQIIHYIHFAGGGASLYNQKIRYSRMNGVYDWYKQKQTVGGIW